MEETISRHFEQAMILLLVVERGSFTRAADALGRSKAQISKQDQALETALGTALLHRTTRRLALTQMGVRFLDYVRQARSLMAEAERAVSANQSEVSGMIRLTAPTSFGDAFLIDLIAEFSALYPDVQFDLDLSIARRDLIADRIDFAIRASRSLDAALIARAVGVMRELIVATPAYLDARNWSPPDARRAESRGPEDLRQLHLIHNVHFADELSWTLIRGDESRNVDLGSRLRINHFGAIRRACLAGMGCARLPNYLVHGDLQSGALRQLLPDWQLPATPIHVVYASRQHMPLRNRMFLEFMLDWFARAPVKALLGG